MQRLYVECACECGEHLLRISFDPDDGEVYVSTYLSTWHAWYARLWIAIKYVFGSQSKFGAFDCTILKPDDYPKLHELLDWSIAAHRMAQEKLVKGE